MGRDIKNRLAVALRRAMETSTDLKTIEALAKKSGIPKSTIDRTRNAGAALGIDKLEPIAKAFDLQPWEFLRQAYLDADHIKKFPKAADPDPSLLNISPEAHRLISAIAKADTSHTISQESLKLISDLVASMATGHDPVAKIPRRLKAP